MTSTGSVARVPSSSGIRFGGNHKSHCAASPGDHNRRSAGSTRQCSGFSRATFSRNHDDDPDHPTRSAITDAGMSGNSASSAATRSANGVNDVTSAGGREYFGGPLDATALATVFREISSRLAICVCGTPSAASLRINAQSSKVITLQSLSAHSSTGRHAQFSAVIDKAHNSQWMSPRMTRFWLVQRFRVREPEEIGDEGSGFVHNVWRIIGADPAEDQDELELPACRLDRAHHLAIRRSLATIRSRATIPMSMG
jgi:hypothetical protein